MVLSCVASLNMSVGQANPLNPLIDKPKHDPTLSMVDCV